MTLDFKKDVLVNNLAPIVLFVYNRPEHTDKTLSALKGNTLAINSDLFIFSDGARDDVSSKSILEVRELISDVSGFKSVTVIEQISNIGLANSVISGVSDVISKYGKVIVLEDDMVTSPFFLEYMNNALCKYKESPEVWHISGWNYPIQPEKLDDTFFWHTMNCWGWATWSDKWSYFTKNPSELVKSWEPRDIHAFNLDGTYNFWEQVERNIEGKIDTWAIFWYATIFENNGLCLNPSKTLVKNIGYDGSGVNCGSLDLYPGEVSEKLPKLTDNLMVNVQAVDSIKQYYRSLKPSLYRRVLNKVKRICK